MSADLDHLVGFVAAHPSSGTMTSNGLDLAAFHQRLLRVNWRALDPREYRSTAECIMRVARCTGEVPEDCCYALEFCLLPQGSLSEIAAHAIPFLGELAVHGLGLPCIYELFGYILCAVESNEQHPLCRRCRDAIHAELATCWQHLASPEVATRTRVQALLVFLYFPDERPRWQPLLDRILASEPGTEIAEVILEELAG